MFMHPNHFLGIKSVLIQSMKPEKMQERQELKQSTVLNKSTIGRTWKVNANVGLRDTESSANIFFSFFVPYKSPPHSHYSEGRICNKRCHVGCHNSLISDTQVFQQRKSLLDNRNILLEFGECISRLLDEPSCFLINIGSRSGGDSELPGPTGGANASVLIKWKYFLFTKSEQNNSIGQHL